MVPRTLPLSHFSSCHAGLSLACAGLRRELGVVLKPGTKAWQRSAHRATLLAGVVSVNWQREEEIKL